MVILLQIIGATIGVLFTSVMTDAPRLFIPINALVGGLGWGVYLLLEKEQGPLFACYISGLCIAFLAQILARRFKTPVTVILIPGFYPLVPGVGMFRSILYLIQGQEELFRKNLSLTLLLAGMIALAIFTVDSVVTSFFRIRALIRRMSEAH